MQYGFKSVPQGPIVTMVLQDGSEKKTRLRKSVPPKCSRPRQICIRCTRTVIHKNDKRYDSKICEACG